MDFDLLDKAVLAALLENSGRPGDLFHVDAVAERPFFVVYNTTSSNEQGGMGHPERMLEVFYQVTSVGDTFESCRWMASRLYSILLERDGGGYRYIMPVEGGEVRVIGRALSVMGACVQADERSYNQNDNYSVMVQHVPA